MNIGKFLKRAFVAAGADVQADLINNWAAELYAQCKGERDFETQCCYISDDLDSKGRKFIKLLAEYVELREEGE